MMSSPAVVLIHSQGNAVGPLREAIEHYMPQMVFLISNHGADKAMLALEYLKQKNEGKLGKSVRNIEHFEMIFIDDGVSKDTILQMFEAIETAKQKAISEANGRVLKFYAGIAGGTKPMVIGSALAAINGNMNSYYVKEERPGHTENLLFEIDFMNNLMSAVHWLREHYTNVRNLRYLRELVRREENGEVCTAEEIALTLQPITAKSVQNAMRVLKTHGLVEIHKGKIKKKKTQTFSPTRLGYHVLNMYPSSNEEE
jgi:hypothetical protein